MILKFLKKRNDLEFKDVSLYNYWKNIKNCRRRYIRRINLIKYFPIVFILSYKGFSIWYILLCCLWWLLVTVFYDHREIRGFEPRLRVWFGVPGAGKTTMGAWLARDSINQGVTVLSNVEIKDTYRLDSDDLGTYDMSFNDHGCHVISDEGSLDFDNRNHSQFAKSNKPKYFALYRHMSNMCDIFSQGYDIDKRIRDRTSKAGLYQIDRFFFKGFIYVRRIKKVLFIKKDDKQLVDGFEYRGLPRIIYARSVWDSFDTLDKSLCPKAQKQWKKWNEEEEKSGSLT